MTQTRDLQFVLETFRQHGGVLGTSQRAAYRHRIAALRTGAKADQQPGNPVFREPAAPGSGHRPVPRECDVTAPDGIADQAVLVQCVKQCAAIEDRSDGVIFEPSTSFFNEKGHQMIQRNGAWCEHCEGELILVWQPGDAS